MRIRTQTHLGTELRRLRRNKQLTQANLAKKAGLRQSTVSDIESGRVATTETLFKVFAALDIELQFISIERGAALFDFEES